MALHEPLVERILGRLKKSDVDYWDVRFDSASFVEISKDVTKEEISNSTLAGVHVRVLKQGEWRSCSIADGGKQELGRIEKLARFRPSRNRKNALATLQPWKYDETLEGSKNPEDVSLDEKTKFVRELYTRTKNYSDRIVNARIHYGEVIVEKTFTNSEGSWLRFKGPVIRVRLAAFARENGTVQWDYDAPGEFGVGFEFAESINEERCTAVAKNAIALLKADRPPSGRLPAVLDSSLAGVLAHESFGHGLEADQVLRGRSYLERLLGTLVASEVVSITDNSAYPKAYGSYPFDDEGIRTKSNRLVDHGILKTFLHSRETAAHFGVEPTGNGRSESFSKKVFVRMSNTYFEAGDWTLEEMMEDVDYGVYLVKFTSGMEDPLGGSLQATSHRGYLIEGGKPTKLLRSATLSGRVLELLKNVDAVGKEFELFPGTCGKGFDDYVRVSSGGVPLRIKEAVVGGG